MFIQMVKDMKGNSSQMLSQVKENIIMQMEISMKENGKMIYTTDMVRKDIMMVQCMRVLGFVTKKMAQVFLQIQMGKDIGKFGTKEAKSKKNR